VEACPGLLQILEAKRKAYFKGCNWERELIYFKISSFYAMSVKGQAANDCLKVPVDRYVSN
jgi:hypothetical protein